jgi:hypothetical protein
MLSLSVCLHAPFLSLQSLAPLTACPLKKWMSISPFLLARRGLLYRAHATAVADSTTSPNRRSPSPARGTLAVGDACRGQRSHPALLPPTWGTAPASCRQGPRSRPPTSIPRATPRHRAPRRHQAPRRQASIRPSSK